MKTQTQPLDRNTGEIMHIRTPYNYDTDEVSNSTGLACPEPTLTQQQFKDETDINTIVDRFGVTGEFQAPPSVTQEDFVEVFDYQTAANTIRAAQESFMAQPAKVRARFQNDPQKMLEFIADSDNVEEAIKLGLAIKREPITEKVQTTETETKTPPKP